MTIISRIRTNGENVIVPMDSIGIVVSQIYADRVYDIIKFDPTDDNYRLEEVTDSGSKQVIFLNYQQLCNLIENNEIVEISN